MGATESACHTWINETATGTPAIEPASSNIWAYRQARLHSGDTIVMAEQSGASLVEQEYSCFWNAGNDL